MVVMPAYNAAKTLRFTYRDLPLGLVDQVILVARRGQQPEAA